MIFVYSELTKDKEVRPVSLQLVSKAVELKSKLQNSSVVACVFSYMDDYESIISSLKSAGADKVIIINDEKLGAYNGSLFSHSFLQVAKQYNPEIILFGATYEGKEIASYVAVNFETGLTADCTNLSITEDGKLLSTRPTFGGQLIADILCRTNPQMATVQENVFPILSFSGDIDVIYENVDFSQVPHNIEIISTTYKELSNVDVASAKIVVTGGLGACTDMGFELINQLAKKLDGAVAGTREAYEKGFITKSQQIGQTGKTVAPSLYIAVGVSGANQHLTGIKNSGKIIAINKDKNAPIFQHADIGIVGDLYEVLPQLIDLI